MCGLALTRALAQGTGFANGPAYSRELSGLKIFRLLTRKISVFDSRGTKRPKKVQLELQIPTRQRVMKGGVFFFGPKSGGSLKKVKSY